MRQLAMIVLLAAVSCLFGGCVAWSNYTATSKTHEVHPHIAGTPVVVDTQNGSIQIVADPKVADVEIDATLRCGGATQAEADEHLTQAIVSIVRDSTKTLTIKAILPEDDRGRHGANFVIRLPDADGVTARTSNGSIIVTGLAGELVADTSNGSVSISDHNGPVRIETSNGSVNVQRVAGALTVDTSNGNVEATDVGGPVKIDTSNGSIAMKLNPEHNGPLHLDSSNGSIRATVGAKFVGVMKLNTSNGSITVTDSAGRIKSQVIDKSSGQLVIGDGGESSIIDTSNGRIEVVIAD